VRASFEGVGCKIDCDMVWETSLTVVGATTKRRRANARAAGSAYIHKYSISLLRKLVQVAIRIY